MAFRFNGLSNNKCSTFTNILPSKKRNLARKITSIFTWRLVLQGIAVMLYSSQPVLAGQFVACLTTLPCDSAAFIEHLDNITDETSYELKSLNLKAIKDLTEKFTYILILLDAEKLMNDARGLVVTKFARLCKQHERQFKFIIMNPGLYDTITLSEKLQADAVSTASAVFDLDIIIFRDKDDIKDLSIRLEQERDSLNQG